ncbi:MAG TPA: prolipoprotein diacylglyceryl transferase [Candidatus Sulfotelmatobacter sp.]|nr:prolipoprotein diacylglyceryl transferase [Candidatus Sulfotelmatobacter sp.]
MIPVILRLGPVTIYSYGLMMALGFIAGDLLLSHECRRRGFDSELGTAIVVWGAIGGLAGARLYDVLDNWAAYMSHPASIIFSGAGFIWYGGLIGGLVSTWLVAKRHRVPFLTVADMCAAPLVLGMAFGRIGCLLSGDGDWGLPSKLPWAMAYPRAIVGWGPETVLKLDSHDNLVSGFFPGVRVHPTPIYEAILYVGIFAFLWSIRRRVTVQGELLYLYLILAGTARFLVEFVRINSRVLWGLSEAQVISLIMIAAGSMAWYWSRRRAEAVSASREALRA